jgi:glucose-6-phosphate dehydrogenase assembly protein OpcA
MPEPTVLEWSGKDVDLTTVERQISSLWKQLASGQKQSCPVRTHVFNLVVYAANRAQAQRVEQNLAHLEDRQPSRTIILYGDRTLARSAIDAEVSVTCPPKSGDRPPRCFERLSVFASGRAADHLASVVTPLLMPELRTYLWWPGQPPFGYRAFHRLLALADQLVIDSSEFVSPGDGLIDIARLSRGRQGVNDFHWARLVSWRDIITQCFDGPGHVEYARAIQKLNLEFGSGGGLKHHQSATAGLLLILGWAGNAFNWQPETTLEGLLTDTVELSVVQDNRLIPIQIRFTDHGKEAAGKLMLVEIECGGPGLAPACCTVERTSDLRSARVSQSMGSESTLERVVPLDLRTDAELLVDELELTGHDSLYEQSAEYATRIAGRVIWSAT